MQTPNLSAYPPESGNEYTIFVESSGIEDVCCEKQATFDAMLCHYDKGFTAFASLGPDFYNEDWCYSQEEFFTWVSSARELTKTSVWNDFVKRWQPGEPLALDTEDNISLWNYQGYSVPTRSREEKPFRYCTYPDEPMIVPISGAP
jgi:hypothetical protein